jgi:hypothetical protein
MACSQIGLKDKYNQCLLWYSLDLFNKNVRGHRGHDHMVVGYTTTYAIMISNPAQVYSIQHYVIKCVSDFRQVKPPLLLKWCGNARRHRFSATRYNTFKRSKYSCGHLYSAVTCIEKVIFFLSCHGKFLMNWTSFQRSPVLNDHLFFVPFDCIYTLIGLINTVISVLARSINKKKEKLFGSESL